MKTRHSSNAGRPWHCRGLLANQHSHRLRAFGHGTALLAVLLLVAMASATAVRAAAPALNAQMVARPVTPGDITKYALPASTETSGGLTTVGIGTPVYLEVEINNAIAPSNIVNVTWAITNKPLGSTAVLTASPLGTNIGVYEPSSALAYEVVSRQMLRPDVTGSAGGLSSPPEQYTVVATITATGYAVTNVSMTITAGTYVGVNTCALCHSGGLVAPEKVEPWETTAHSMIFTQGITGQLGSYSVSCLKCHTVGYDTTASSLVDNGFYAVSQQLGWVFPTNTGNAILAATNWAYMQSAYPSLANLANIQCENCHGPGSQHAYSLGNTNLISVTTTSTGDCNQCHDAPSHHIYGTEWYASSHAITTTIPSGPTHAVCVGCHTSDGFIGRINAYTTTNTVYSAIGCQTCHEPHGQTIPTNNPHLLRVLSNVALGDGTLITNAGEAELCLECHHSRDGGASNNVTAYAAGQNTWIGGSSFGPHDGPQGDMIEGANAITYGLSIPSSPHRSAITNACVGCHMQPLASSDPGLYLAGGHTTQMSYTVITNGTTNKVDEVGACTQCHGQISSFNFPVADVNGSVVGVQDEVQGLLNQLSTLLPNSSGVIDGRVQTSLSVKTNWTIPQLNAAYNWQFVANDGSLGVHNAPFAVGILQASIANLTGSSAGNGIPDAWATEYFGSPSNPLAAPNASPAGDGIPNWLKYALGLNPLVKGMTVPGGVVYANGTAIGGGTNSIQIYTAAEVAFNTVPGSTYQVQEVSALSQGWQTISTNIPGTGSSYSYLTPMRNHVQQYFRVVHNP